MSIARACLLALSTVFLNGVLALRLGEDDEGKREEVEEDDEEDEGCDRDSLIVEAGSKRTYNYEIPSGNDCETQMEWGDDGSHGNPELKAYLGNCTDQVEIDSDNIQLLKNYGCHHHFDVVSWAEITGLRPPHRKPKTGGLLCAKAFKFKKDPPSECFNEDRPHVLTLYAPVSGKKGPKPIVLEDMKSGTGLNWIQSNYTAFLGQHPRAWDSRRTLRMDMGICTKWNALDTVVEVVATGSATQSNMHIIVGFSDENQACGKKKKTWLQRSKTLKALMCIYPLSNYMKVVDVQDIHWHPPDAKR